MRLEAQQGTVLGAHAAASRLVHIQLLVLGFGQHQPITHQPSPIPSACYLSRHHPPPPHHASSFFLLSPLLPSPGPRPTFVPSRSLVEIVLTQLHNADQYPHGRPGSADISPRPFIEFNHPRQHTTIPPASHRLRLGQDIPCFPGLTIQNTQCFPLCRPVEMSRGLRAS